MSVNLFDADFYRAANPDLVSFNDAEALSHFQTSGLNEGRVFSPFANLNFYRSSNSDLVGFNNQQAFEHLQNFGVAEGRRFSQFADINYYLSVNSDVSQTVGGNREQAFEHLRGFGVNEGRSFSPYVDLDYYLSANLDVNQAFGDNLTLALEHLETLGLDEGRQFSAGFDVNFYRNTYPDLTSAGLTTNRSLFEHWVSYGVVLDKRFGTPAPGNTLATALNLGSPAASTTVFNGFIERSDIQDYYRLTLNESRNISAALSGLSTDLDLILLDDNGNAIAFSSGDGSVGESLSYFELNSGTYFIQVYQTVPGSSSNYSLSIDVLPSQDPGATPNNAYPLSVGSLPFNAGIRGFISGSDTDDYYRFNLTETAAASAQLNPLNANADLVLLNSSGTAIASSTAGGLASDSISSTSLTAGTYFLGISGFSNNTGYNLNVNFV